MHEYLENESFTNKESTYTFTLPLWLKTQPILPAINKWHRKGIDYTRKNMGKNNDHFNSEKNETQ